MVYKLVMGEDFILLKNLGGVFGSIDVFSCVDWSVFFDIVEVVSDGCLLFELVLDVLVVLGVMCMLLVVLVFFNDVLLGVCSLQVDGQCECIIVCILLGVLVVQNQLCVFFVCQFFSDNCCEMFQVFLVVVLGFSYLKLDKVQDEVNFIGMVCCFVVGVQLLVLYSYLDDVLVSLQCVIMVVFSVGLFVDCICMIVVDDGKEVVFFGSFLVFDLFFKDVQGIVQVKGNMLVMNDSSVKFMFDVIGFDCFGILEVVKINGQ